MYTTTIRAYEVDPKYCKSPLQMDLYHNTNDWDVIYSGLNLIGNCYFSEHTTELYDSTVDALRYAVLDYNDLMEDAVNHTGEDLNNLVLGILRFRYLVGKNKILTAKEMQDWIDILSEKYSSWDSYLSICTALTLITGHEYDYTTLRGCCQSDWQDVIYDTELWSQELLDKIEIELFNMGTEYTVSQVQDDGTEYSYSNVYVYSYDEDEIKTEILEYLGFNPEDFGLENVELIM